METFVSLGNSYSNEYKICALQNAVALLFAATNMILNFLVLAIIHERAPREGKLPDISFDILPEAAWGLDVAEYIISIQAFLVLTLLFLHRYRVILFRRLCLVMGIIYFARAICMSSTQVPLIKTDYCAKPMSDEQKASWASYLSEIFRRVFQMMLGFGLSINGRHVYCGDYIFSGHTVTLTFFYLFLREYMMPKMTSSSIFWAVFHAIILASSLVGVILILIARGHYLIDVLIAYFITTSTFYIYHTIIHNKSLRYANQKNYLSRFWWWNLMKYLEYDHVTCSNSSSRSNGVCLRCESTNTEVPRKFDWPFSWPRSSDERRSTSLQRLLSQT